MEELNLCHNELLALDPCLRHCDRVTDLDVSYNRLQSISPWVRAGCTVLRTCRCDVACGGGDVDGGVSQFGCLERLVCLDLSHNRLASLPQTVGESVVMHCDADAHTARGLPYETCTGLLACLTALDLSHNYLHTLPVGMCGLTVRRIVCTVASDSD